MPLLKRSKGQLRPGSKIIAVEAVGRIPEGTRGTVKVVDGFEKWIRYWVMWETGDWTGSVDGSQIVAADRFEQYKVERAEAAERALTQAAAAAVAPAVEVPADVGAGGGAGGRVPEHLLERSREARARKAAQSA